MKIKKIIVSAFLVLTIVTISSAPVFATYWEETAKGISYAYVNSYLCKTAWDTLKISQGGTCGCRLSFIKSDFTPISGAWVYIPSGITRTVYSGTIDNSIPTIGVMLETK